MAEHDPGAMQITQHKNTFAGFVSLTAKLIVTVLVVLAFLALFVA